MHDPSTMTLILLVLAAACAGWVDAVVGGGGLIQLPALMVAFPHASPAHLLATNKLASICGTSTSAVTYWKRVRPDPRTAWLLAAFAFLGALGGASVATFLPRSAFNPIILVVLVAVGIYTVARPALGQVEDLRHLGTRRHGGTAAALGAVIGFYDGALGPGTGSFFVFGLVSLLGYRFLEASAKAKLANFATNLAALVVFAFHGSIEWRLGLLLGAANLVGAYLGARTAVSKGAGFVRVVFIVVVSAFIVKLGYDTAQQYGLI